jgi:hypothetical protein
VTRKAILAGVAMTTLLMMGSQAMALPSNVDEPTGPVILDLNGTAIPHAYQHYTQGFTTAASSTSTDLGFAFREDPAFILLDNVSLVADGSLTNLVVNGGFEIGSGSSPTGWSFQNPNGATFQGVIQAGTGVGGTNAWFDGSVQAYDTLFQNIATVGGTHYTVSFDMFDDGSLTTFSRLSTNGNVTDTGGNGANLVVYAGVGAPVLRDDVPEPAAWALMLVGFGGLGALLRRRRAVVATA